MFKFNLIYGEIMESQSKLSGVKNLYFFALLQLAFFLPHTQYTEKKKIPLCRLYFFAWCIV